MKPLPSHITEALAAVYPRLAASNIRWLITGSVGMLLQGMPLDPHDLDLQSDRNGAHAIMELFPEWVEKPVFWKESAAIRSVFGVLSVNGVQVEVMGDMGHRLADGSWSTPVDIDSIMRWVDYEGMRLPVADLEHEYTAYRLMGREAKAQAIRAFLDGRTSQEGG